MLKNNDSTAISYVNCITEYQVFLAGVKFSDIQKILVISILEDTYRSLQVYQRSNTQVGQRVLSDFTPTNVRPNCPTKSSQVGVRVSTLR